MSESQPTRIAFLRERVETRARADDRQTFDVPFRQRSIPLVKIDIPIGFPLYNVHSGRTHRAQRRWIEDNGQPSDFFTDPEDEEVQQVQHQLLLAMIGEEGLDADLARRPQQNPVVLTYDGFIVDGNRRVTALREAGDVENIVAVVLPEDALVSEMFETELELQMARETRADYNWIDQALHVRYGVQDLGESTGAVATRMNIPERGVQEILASLVLVDLYLEWAGTPDGYHRVPAESEQAFSELRDREGRSQVQNLPEAHRQTVRLACFAVIQSPGGGYMDVRRVADSIRAQPAVVAGRLRDRLPDELAGRLDEPIDLGGEDNGDGGGLLAELAAAADEHVAPAGTEVINVVRDPADARISAPVLIDVAKDLAEEGRETQAQLEPLRKIERALQILRSVQITEETRELRTVAERLGDLIAAAERIGIEVGEHTQPDSA